MVTEQSEDWWGAHRPLANLKAEIPIRPPDHEDHEVRVAYELPDIPVSPTFLNDPDDEDRAWVLADWLRQSERSRSQYITDVLCSMGAPLVSLNNEPEDLRALSRWVAQWIPYVLRKQRLTVRSLSTSEARNGPSLQVVPLEGDWVKALSYRTRSGFSYSPGDFVKHSLVCDLAMLVVSFARKARPDLEWMPHPKPRGLRLRRTETWRWDPIFNPAEPWWSPTMRVSWFVAAAMGVRKREVEPNLYSIYKRQVVAEPKGNAPPDPLPEALPTDSYFTDLVRLIEPGPDEPDPSMAVVEAVTAFQRAGWFQAEKQRSVTSLAAALTATYRMMWGWEVDERLRQIDEIDKRLIILDGKRTIFLDSDAGVTPGYMVYRAVLSVLAKLSGGAYVILRSKEDWEASPGHVEVSFLLNGDRHSFSLLDTGRWLNPAVVTELNGLLPAQGPRYWFIDTGGQMGAITRATKDERQVLEALRPISLSAEPPDWWQELSS